jgi:hypothetical protein
MYKTFGPLVITNGPNVALEIKTHINYGRVHVTLLSEDNIQYPAPG